jgi:(2Fe-2S) ferredoxin
MARRFRVVICRGPECGDRRGSAALHDAFRASIDARGGVAGCELAWQSCFGRCTQGPNVLVRELVDAAPGALVGTGFAALPGPRGLTALYNHVDAARAERIVDEHVCNAQIVREFIERPGIQPTDAVASRTKEP